MSLPRSYVDGFLVEWEEGEYQAQVKSMRQKSEKIVLRIGLSTVGGSGRKRLTTAEQAQRVRDRLARTVRKVPEVMVKITSACKGMTQIGRHIDYISRKGQIDIEDQDGMILRGKDQLKALKDDWRTGGPEEIADESDRRDTLNIVFSMPAHTDEVAMKRAVREFATAEFEGHQYVFAYHTQATDPDPDPPAHPHVHLSVKTQGRSGRRLNPKKADLQRWREAFAAQLRDNGIEANATSRLARLNLDRGESRTVLALREKGEGPSSGHLRPASTDRIEKAKKLEADRWAYYVLAASTLAQSEVPADRQLAVEIAKHFQNHEPSQSAKSLSPPSDRPASGRYRER
jgi:hypothetical protein